MSEAGGFKDHFSQASDDYRRWRPRYPRDFFEWLAEQAPARELAWDCATGNGQAATVLGDFFERVVATDASAAQVAEAEPHAHVEYRVAAAEDCPLADASCDVVTVAQALHWFDIPRFHDEVRRVLRPGGVIAEWTYGLARVAPEITAAVIRFSTETVGRYWPPERKMVDNAYADVPFPFERIEAPRFAMRASWDLDRFLAYTGTWSSVAGYRKATGNDPLPALREEMAPLWGDGEREVRWPLLARVGRI